MTPVECEFEADVLCAVLQSRWPERVESELRTHVAHCQICRDVTLVSTALAAEVETMRPSAQLPDSGRVWWLAQLRARREAVKNAGRPITAAHVLIFACAMGLLGACFGATSAWCQESVHGLGISLGALDAAALLAGNGLVITGIAALLIIVPVAVYLTLARD